MMISQGKVFDLIMKRHVSAKREQTREIVRASCFNVNGSTQIVHCI